MSTAIENDYAHLLGKVRDAARGGADAWAAQSTGEKLAVALALNRPDWLAEMSYTIPEAIERIGPTWCGLLPKAAAAVQEDRRRLNEAMAKAAEAEAVDAVLAGATVDLEAEFVTYGYAPGYRDAELTFNLRHRRSARVTQAALRLRPQDAESIVSALKQAHRAAWAGGKPLDAASGESRPSWI